MHMKMPCFQIINIELLVYTYLYPYMYSSICIYAFYAAHFRGHYD